MTTPFDMTVLNYLDGFHFRLDVVNRVPRLRATGAHSGSGCKPDLPRPSHTFVTTATTGLR